MGKLAEAAGEQGLLHLAGNAYFLLEALALPVMLDETRILQDAGSFHSKRVEDPAIEVREGGWAAGIQIDGAKKLPSLVMDGRFFGSGSYPRIERDHNHGPKPLLHYAHGCLKVGGTQREVSRDNVRSLVQSQA